MGSLQPHELSRDEPEREQKLEELIRVAILHLRKGTSDSYLHAAAEFELARELAPDDPRILDGLGCVAVRQQNFNTAEHLFKEAILRNNSYDRAYAHLAYIADMRGEKKAAEELLAIAVKINPLNYRARNNYAVLLVEQEGEAGALPSHARDELLKAYHTYTEPDVVLGYNVRAIGDYTSNDKLNAAVRGGRRGTQRDGIK